jgi:hypothetical protein
MLFWANSVKTPLEPIKPNQMRDLAASFAMQDGNASFSINELHAFYLRAQ